MDDQHHQQNQDPLLVHVHVVMIIYTKLGVARSICSGLSMKKHVNATGVTRLSQAELFP